MSHLSWQRPGDMNMRKMVKRVIRNMLDEGDIAEEKKCHITEVAEWLELHFYNSATSAAEYINLKTLKPRIQMLSMDTNHPLLQALDLLERMLLSKRMDRSRPEADDPKHMWLHCSRCANPKCPVLYCNEVRHLLIHRCNCEENCQICNFIDYMVPPMEQFLQNLQSLKDRKRKYDALPVSANENEKKVALTLVDLKSAS